MTGGPNTPASIICRKYFFDEQGPAAGRTRRSVMGTKPEKSEANQRLAQERALVAIEDALKARRNRIQLESCRHRAAPVDRNHRTRHADPGDDRAGTY